MTNHIPAPLRYREDGWTPDVQARFLDALAMRGSVRYACQEVGRCTGSAYRLRALPGAEAFRNAWAEAIAHGYENLRDIAFDRITDGEREAIIENGEIRGYKRKFDNKLLMNMLNHLHRVSQLPPAAAPAPDPHAEAAAEHELALVTEARTARVERLGFDGNRYRSIAQLERAATDCEVRDADAADALAHERDTRQASPWCRLSADFQLDPIEDAELADADPDPAAPP